MRLMIALGAVFTVIALTAPAFATCDEDAIDTLSSDGDLIVLESGVDIPPRP
jgi:hypothetical protein